MKPLLIATAAVAVAFAGTAACRPDTPAAWLPPTDRGTICAPVWIESDHREVLKCWPA